MKFKRGCLKRQSLYSFQKSKALVNHPSKVNKQVDRKECDKQKREYWNKEFDTGK
jgi:hypothetical protein